MSKPIEFFIGRDDESGKFRVSIKYGSKEDMDLGSEEDFEQEEAEALVRRIRAEAAFAKVTIDPKDYRTDDSGGGG